MNKINIFTAYNNTKKLLRAAGIEDFATEARYIIRHVTGYDNAKILTNYADELTPLQQTVLNNIVSRRATRYPLQYILGVWQFYGLDLFVGKGVLIPRSDTETLVDKALEFLKGKEHADVLDLCAGSGCIGIAVAKNADCRVTAVEKSPEAYEYLEKNNRRHGNCISAVLADAFEYTPAQQFDLITCNPPYISESELKLMNKETEFEPSEALFASDNGLEFYKRLIPKYKPLLKSGGALIMEIGCSQGDAVKGLFEAAGFENIECLCDYGGNQRVVFGTAK
ncbi:MAG: peptide chain release factor N(5)-glutamine methyltransferase [Clostridia bacterium]|nr:peptide chain release factor N(5)-glutamine methyltransferase [Clostridia bacterium]